MVEYWSPTDIAWVAGVVEGEGCLTVGTPSIPRAVRLSVAMTDEDVVRRLHAVTGIGKVYAYQRDPYKPQWIWRVTRRLDVARLLCALTPMMGDRRRERFLEAAQILPFTKRGSRVR